MLREQADAREKLVPESPVAFDLRAAANILDPVPGEMDAAAYEDLQG